ncbi:hypothetical protein ACFFWD_23700 [Bradyrhizobium erythrophlei]|uniref:hypothetical protein n=1 Tax=Bradyrhizobium erythrophlei TaxID=1437360 RepID=UPI0035EF312C
MLRDIDWARAMNIFGAVTFGSLIKTFLPDLVWLIAFAILDNDLALLLGYESYLWSALKNKDLASTLLVLAFPASILVGLLSNVIVFMGLNDLFVRNPFKRKHRELFSLHATLSDKVRDQCWTAMKIDDQSLRASFYKWTDPEIIIVERIGADKLAYVREQYWYHLEFQLNLLISLVAVFVALGTSVLINRGFSPAIGGERIAAAIIVCGFVCYGLLRAAQKNYERHIAKMASLMTALLSQPNENSE